MIIKYDPVFWKILKKSNIRIKKNAKKQLLLFSKRPKDSQLNNHPLKREWQGHRSIDITSDWRAIYKEIREGKETIAYFVTLGTHKDLYK